MPTDDDLGICENCGDDDAVAVLTLCSDCLERLDPSAYTPSPRREGGEDS